jgi:hypothetical protein
LSTLSKPTSSSAVCQTVTVIGERGLSAAWWDVDTVGPTSLVLQNAMKDRIGIGRDFRMQLFGPHVAQS